MLNYIDNNRVSTSLTAKGKRSLIIDRNTIFLLNKERWNDFGTCNLSWQCKQRTCSGRATSERNALDSPDINVSLTKSNMNY
jgi:hypothetical protein